MNRPLSWDTFPQRFAAMWEAVPEAGCWLWLGNTGTGFGYGSIAMGNGLRMGAHRASWVLHHGPIPDGMFVCHKCDTPSCVNPNHLFLGRAIDNVRDMFSKGRNGNASGEKAAGAKLSAAQVAAIRNDDRPCRTIGAEYGVSQATVSAILRGDSWDGPRLSTGRRRGSRHGRAKLTERDIPAIRNDSRKQRDIAKDYGVDQQIIGRIKRRIIWAHVP